MACRELPRSDQAAKTHQRETRTYLINAFCGAKLLKRQPLGCGQTILEMTSNRGFEKFIDPLKQEFPWFQQRQCGGHRAHRLHSLLTGSKNRTERENKTTRQTYLGKLFS
jgi:hypothetical protein